MKISLKNLTKHLISIYQGFINSNLVIVTQKTFKQLYSLKPYLLRIFFLIVGPLFTIILQKPSLHYGALSPQNVARIIKSILITPCAFWSIGLALALIISIPGSSLISDETQSGSIQLLLSRSISRTNVLLGKFLGLFSYAIILNGGSLLIITFLSVLLFLPSIFVFIELIPFLLVLFIYGIIVIFMVVCLSLFISTAFSTSKKSGIIGFFLILVIFLGFSLFRNFARAIAGLYESLQLYHFDIQYHLGNTLVGIIENSRVFALIPDWQISFNQYFGTYDLESYGFNYSAIPYDPEQGHIFGGIKKVLYYIPLLSFFLVVLLSILLLVLTIIIFKKKDF